MASQTESIHRGVDSREDRHGANERRDHEGAEHRVLIP